MPPQKFECYDSKRFGFSTSLATVRDWLEIIFLAECEKDELAGIQNRYRFNKMIHEWPVPQASPASDIQARRRMYVDYVRVYMAISRPFVYGPPSTIIARSSYTNPNLLLKLTGYTCPLAPLLASTQQKNDCDCGVYTLCFSNMLSSGLPIDVADSDMSNARKKIASQLLEGRV